MCTLTYIPRKKAHCLITSNRDESIHRSIALPPAAYSNGVIRLWYPKDPDGGGSWFAVAEDGRIACLLNGAFKPHKRNPPYRKSRGLVLLDSFQWKSPNDLLKHYDFAGIEPFTLVLFNPGDMQIDEIRWDGKQVYHSQPDGSSPHIWSSVTVYTPEIIAQREKLFIQWLQNHPSPSLEEIRAFHHFSTDEHNVPIMIKPGGPGMTVSITAVEYCDGKMNMVYEDLINEKIYRFTITETCPKT